MADKRIVDFTQISAITDTCEFVTDNTISTFKASAPQILDYINAKRRSPIDLLNYSLAASVAASALTIALKDFLGNNAQSSSPVGIMFRTSPITGGLPALRQVSAALSTVISSGSTAGHFDGVDSYLHIYAIDHSGTVELAWSGSKAFDEGKLHNTTAEGGSGGATDGGVLYSTTARTGVPVRYLGRMTSNQTTAGTWAAAPIEICSSPLEGGRPNWSGYQDGSWTSTGSSLNDGSNSGGNTITPRFKEGMSVAAGASNVAGLTFTPAIGAVYKIKATVSYAMASGTTPVYAMTDGSVEIGGFNGQLAAGGTNIFSGVAEGLYKPDVDTPVTVKIQMAYGTSIEPSNSPGHSIDWLIEQVA